MAQIYSSQGLNYYVRDNYYTRDKVVENSEWFGRGANELGLSGAVDAVKFQRLLDGYDPEGRDSLTGIPVKHYGCDDRGKQIKHRAGFDITFSPPKSVSLAAYLGGFRAAEDAHRAAVDKTLALVERHHSVVREGERSNRRQVVTGNLIVAKFHHDTSRERDPQMHTHCVIVSASKRSDGKWRRTSTDTFFKNSAFINQCYMNSLAQELRVRGVRIVKTEGAFEIDGYSREQIEAFSKRTLAIEALKAPDKRTERVVKLRQRPAKGAHAEMDDLAPQWHSRAKNITHPPLKGAKVGVADRAFARAQEVSARRNLQPEAFSARVVQAATQGLGRTRQPTRNDVAAEMMRREPGLFPSIAVLDSVKHSRELVPLSGNSVTLRQAFASKDDILKRERPTTLLPSPEDIHRSKPQDVSLFPGLDAAAGREQSQSGSGLATRLALDAATTFTPVVNDFRDAYEGVTGRDLVTGRKLSPAERVVTLGGLISGSGAIHRKAMKFATRAAKEVTAFVQQTGEKRSLGEQNPGGQSVMVERSERYKLADLELERGMDRERRDPFAKRAASASKAEQQVAAEKDRGIEGRKAVDAEKAPDRSQTPETRREQTEKPRPAQDITAFEPVQRSHQEIDVSGLDPETAMWVKAREEGKRELAEEARATQVSKQKKLDGDTWKDVQVEGYNKAGYREELDAEQAKDKGKNHNRSR